MIVAIERPDVLTEPEEIRMRSHIRGIAAAAAVFALTFGAFLSATQAVEFHGLQFVNPGDGEIRFASHTQVLTSANSPHFQIQTTPAIHTRVDTPQEAGDTAHG
jgi:hypothetical protein